MAKARRSRMRCTKCSRMLGVAQYYANKRRNRATQPFRQPCKACTLKYLAANWRRRYAKAKSEVFAHYGAHCQCCDTTGEVFLTIDHVRGGGSRDRRAKAQGVSIYLWLVKHSFPPGFQVLCHNCNWARYATNGRCPHRSKPR